MTKDAEEAKSRYLAEKEEAKRQQGREDARDWWTVEPSVAMKTGVPRDKAWDRYLKEEARGCAHADKSLANDAGEAKSGKDLAEREMWIEGNSAGQGNAGGLILAIRGKPGDESDCMHLPGPGLYDASMESESDMEGKGGVICNYRDMTLDSVPRRPSEEPMIL